MIKSRSMSWAGHVARMKYEMLTQFVGKPERKTSLGIQY